MNAFEAQPVAIDGHATVPGLFWHRATAKPDKIALREKERGIWKAYTWRQYGEAARAIGSGLIALGLQPGEHAAILSDNNKEWLFCDFGVLCAGGISTGIYPTDSPAQVEYLVNDCDAKVLFVEDEEQLDKILAVRERTPGLRKIIVFDMEGLRTFSDPQVMSLDELRALGEAHAREHPGEWEARIGLAQPGDVAIIVYTSGTTGPSKGAMLSHRNIIFQIGAFARVGLHVEETDEALSFLPLCHVAERLGGCYGQLATMHVANFAEAPDTVPQNLREVAPHILVAVPRVWEKLYSVITIQIKEGTALGRLAYKGAIALGYKASAYELEGKPVPALLQSRPRDRRPAGAQEHPRRAGPRPHPLGDHRRGADLARSHRLVLGDGRGGVRGLRADRECRSRHVEPSGTPEDRHHRPGGSGHRADAVAAGRDPAARARTSSRATTTSPRRRPRR